MTITETATAQATIRIARMLEFFLTKTQTELDASYAQWDDYDGEAYLNMTSETLGFLSTIMFDSRDDFVKAIEQHALCLTSAAEARILLATVYQKKYDSLIVSLNKRWTKETFEARCLRLVITFVGTNLPDGYTFEELIRQGIKEAMELHQEVGGTETLNVVTLSQFALSLAETALALAVSVSTVRRLVKCSYLEPRYVGRKMTITRESIEEFVANLPSSPDPDFWERG